VLARWAAALLAVASLLTVTLAVLPDAFYRFLAFPNSIAMVGLGYSLWLTTHTEPTNLPTGIDTPPTHRDRGRTAEAHSEDAVIPPAQAESAVPA
jgi:hypothetical protein